MSILENKTILNLKGANGMLDRALASIARIPSSDFLEKEQFFWKTMQEVPCTHSRSMTRIDGLIK